MFQLPKRNYDLVRIIIWSSNTILRESYNYLLIQSAIIIFLVIESVIQNGTILLKCYYCFFWEVDQDKWNDIIGMKKTFFFSFPNYRLLTLLLWSKCITSCWGKILRNETSLNVTLSVLSSHLCCCSCLVICSMF